jgi:hypothetical protein
VAAGRVVVVIRRVASFMDGLLVFVMAWLLLPVVAWLDRMRANSTTPAVRQRHFHVMALPRLVRGIDRAIGINTMLRAMTRSSRVMTSSGRR